MRRGHRVNLTLRCEAFSADKQRAAHKVVLWKGSRKSGIAPEANPLLEQLSTASSREELPTHAKGSVLTRTRASLRQDHTAVGTCSNTLLGEAGSTTG
jgi:hypothetical protein